MTDERISKEILRVAEMLSGSGRRAAADPVKMAKDIAKTEAEITKLINATYAKAYALAEKSGGIQNDLTTLLRGDASQAEAVVEAMRKGKLNMGSISHRLVDVLEDATGKSLYPVSWPIDEREQILL